MTETVKLAIIGHSLKNYLSTSYRSPAKYASDDDERADMINPEYADWDQQDKLILSWLFESTNDNLVSRMINCESTTQLLKNLSEIYDSQVRATVSPYRTPLRNTR